MAERYARAHGLKTVVLRPAWDRHGRAAGVLRNQEIVDRCDMLVAFWDGKSRGTKDAIERATKGGRRVYVVKQDTV